MSKRSSSGITNGASGVSIRASGGAGQMSDNASKKDQFRKNSVQHNDSGKRLIKDFTDNDVEYKKVNTLKKELSENDIIRKISGGDQTNGSCASLACAYAANKAGYDVTDFRGGISTEIMAQGGVYDMASTNQLKKYTTYSNGMNVSSAKKLMNKMESGEEYILITGHHASVVKKEGNEFHYLELQSNMYNGWRSFGKSSEQIEDTLYDRFGCFPKSSGQKSALINIKGFKENNEVRDILGYVNTATNEQRKGLFGYMW